MGQIAQPADEPALILTAIDKLVAANADGGLAPAVQNVVMLGENAGQNDAASRVYLIGLNAGGGSSPAGMSSSLAGTIAIGAEAAAALRDVGSGGSSQVGSIIAIGENAGAALQQASACVIIGRNALGTQPSSTAARPTRRMVIIGDEACGNLLDNANPRDECVVVGYAACRASGAASQSTAVRTAVIIGTEALGNFSGSGNSITQLVAIGYGAGRNFNCDPSGGSGNTFIGYNAAATALGTGNTAIGAGSNVNNSAGAAECTAIGFNANASGKQSVAIGVGSTIPAGCNEVIALGNGASLTSGNNVTLIGAASTSGTGNGGVRLGYGAGAGETATNAHRWVFETNITGTRRAVLYGDGATGNVCLGNSIPGTNRDFAGNGATNILKLLDGTIGDTNPVGGGYFYVSAGALHWVGSAGTDSVVAPA